MKEELAGHEIIRQRKLLFLVSTLLCFFFLCTSVVLFVKQCIRLDKSKINDNEFVKKYFSSANIKFYDKNLNKKSFYHQRRELADGQLLFLVNSSLNEDVKGCLVILDSNPIPKGG
jgi:hypothetical protein